MWNVVCGIAGAYFALLGAQAFGCTSDGLYLSLLLGVIIGWGFADSFMICFDDIDFYDDDDDDDKKGYA